MSVLKFGSVINGLETIVNTNNVPYIFGFEMKVTGNTTFTLQPGCARGVTNNEDIQYPGQAPNLPGLITVDVSTTGANGCYPVPLADTGITQNTTFPVFALGDSKGANPTIAVVATSATQCFMLPGYDSYARVGLAFINESTLYLIPVAQVGHYTTRDYIFDAAVVALTAGHAVAPAIVDLSTGDGLVPPNWATKVKINATFTANAATDNAFFGHPLNTVLAQNIKNSSTTATTWSLEVPCGVNASTGNAAIQYEMTSASDAMNVSVFGFTDDMTMQINNF